MSAQRRASERTVVLSLGSNLGPREEHILDGVSMLSRTVGLRLVALSSLYESEPVDISTENVFINAVCVASCGLPARELLAVCRGIERRSGRIETGASRDRTLDIDIVLYGNEVVDEADLTIPHPRFTRRLFVLLPLVEIRPRMAVPPSGRTIEDLFRSCAGGAWVRRVSGRTAIR